MHKLFKNLTAANALLLGKIFAQNVLSGKPVTVSTTPVAGPKETINDGINDWLLNFYKSGSDSGLDFHWA